ncbi:MAG: DNA-directed RNA polymerase subunit omega [Eubacterium sp.]|nr:DNA-directed RNA polymerase subunit omega [Eubacterium sp.]
MLHPSYTEILEKIRENEDIPNVDSRYSIVIATSKRARELISGKTPMVDAGENDKALSIAVEELSENKIVILPEQEEDDELTFEGETEEFEEE